MAGCEDYSCVLNEQYNQVEVPLYRATESSVREYGRIVEDFEKEEVRREMTLRYIEPLSVHVLWIYPQHPHIHHVGCLVVVA